MPQYQNPQNFNKYYSFTGFFILDNPLTPNRVNYILMLKQSASADRQILPPSNNPSRTLTGRLRKQQYARKSDIHTEQSRLATQAANLTYFASQRDLLMQINPFDSEFFSAQNPSQGERQNTESNVSEMPLVLAHSENCTRNQFMKLAENRLGHIINPKSRIFTGSYRRTHRDRPKTEEQVMSQDYISQAKRAKRYQKMVREKIQHQFCQLYPQKVTSEVKFQFLTDLPIHQNKSRVQHTYKQIEFMNSSTKNRKKKNEIDLYRTTFYSKSRKRVMVEGYASQQSSARRRPFERRGISFIDYLGARKSKKKELVEASHITGDSSALIKAKNRILKMSRPGSRQLQTLKKCLDQVIIEQVR